MSATENSVTTNYTLDLNAGAEHALWALTQVLQDGTNTYVYGVNPLTGTVGRIAQVAETQTGYFLPDAPPLAHP